MTFDNHQVLLVRKDGRAGSRAEDTHVSPPDPLINRGQGTIISQVQGATHPNEISADLSFFSVGIFLGNFDQKQIGDALYCRPMAMATLWQT